MNEAVCRQIKSLIATQGPLVLDMSGTVASELRLACPGCTGDIDGVVHYLLVLAETGKLETSDLPAQVQRLRAEANLTEDEARGAVDTWADVVKTLRFPKEGEPAWREEPAALHRGRFSVFRDVGIVGTTGLFASMLPWILVLEEKRGRHFLIPAALDLLGEHALLNLMGAAGGFLGGALGWMLGTPLSLEFRVSGGLASARRLTTASLAAGLGSFFGLWLGYHHIADVGAFSGSFLGAGIGAFVASIYTFSYRSLGAWDK
jgi:hypothetical protein